MNTRDDGVDLFCSFIETELDNYICTKCGTMVFSEDGPPPLLCNEVYATGSPESAVPFSTKVKNFIAAAANHIANGAKLCSDEQIEDRYRICNTCEHFLNRACNKCGCPIVRNRQFISKLSWADSECPVGKWGPVN